MTEDIVRPHGMKLQPVGAWATHESGYNGAVSAPAGSVFGPRPRPPEERPSPIERIVCARPRTAFLAGMILRTPQPTCGHTGPRFPPSPDVGLRIRAGGRPRILHRHDILQAAAGGSSLNASVYRGA